MIKKGLLYYVEMGIPLNYNYNQAQAPFACIKTAENGQVSPYLTSSALAKNIENKVASISYNTVSVRDLTTLAVLTTLNTDGSPAYFNSINFSKKNPTQLASCYGKTVTIWDAQSGKAIQTFTSPDEVNQVQFDSDGPYLAYCTNNESKILDVRALKNKFLSLPAAEHITYNKTGSQIALAKNGVIKIFNPINGQLIKEIDKHKDDLDLYSLAYSNNGKWLMSGTDDFVLTLHCLEDDAKTYSVKEPNMLFYSGEFSKDDTQLLTGAVDLSPGPKATTVRIWDLLKKIEKERTCSLQ